jgi:hypothetical protein
MIFKILTFAFFCCSIFQFLAIKHLIGKYLYLKHFLKKYNAQMEMLIIINQELQQKLDESNGNI